MRLVRGLAAVAVIVGTTTLVGPVRIADARSPGVTEYAIADNRMLAEDVVAGPDGRIWFSQNNDLEGNLDPRLVAVSTSGAFTEYPMPHDLDAMTVGPDGNLWITAGITLTMFPDEPSMDPVLLKVSTAGQVLAEIPLPAPPIAGDRFDAATGITVGPDGNLWYARLRGRIGRVTPAGAITEFTVPAPAQGGPSFLGEITSGPDGALWFIEHQGGRVGRVTTSGSFTMHANPGADQPMDIVTGPDGRIWFTDRAAHRIGAITPQGAIQIYPDVPQADEIVVAADGNLWVAGNDSLWRVTSTGIRTEFPLGAKKNPSDLAPGPDGRLWFTQYPDNLGAAHSSVGALTLDDVPTGEFTSLTPTRILDTRTGLGRDGVGAPLGSGAAIDVQVTGRGGVPSSGVAAVVLNATVTGASAGSFLSIWPAGVPQPAVSNLNYGPGDTVPNLVTVGVGSGGRVRALNGAGQAHVVFDVAGYYADEAGPFGSRYVPVDPARLFDTRTGDGGVPAGPVGPGRSIAVDVTGAGDAPDNGVTAVIMNVTVTAPTANGYVTVHPGDVARPLASNLNFTPGTTRANLVTVRVPDDGVVELFNAAGTTHLLADIVGYYSDAVTTNTGRFVPLDPVRLVDSRRGWPIGTDSYTPVSVQRAWPDAAPPWDVSGAVVNVTATAPTAAGYLSVFPNDLCGLPDTSSLNFSAGQTVPNLVVTPLSREPASDNCAEHHGEIGIYNPAGATHYIVDLFGYFTDDRYSDW
jgi:streptogramin lyase